MGNRKMQSEMAKRQNIQNFQGVADNKCVSGGIHNWVSTFVIKCFYPEAPDTHDMLRIGVMCSKCRCMETHQVVILKHSSDMSEETKTKLLNDIAQAKLQEEAAKKKMEEIRRQDVKIPLNTEQNIPVPSEPSVNQDVKTPGSDELITN